MSALNNLPTTSGHTKISSPVELDQLLQDVGTANPQELLGEGAQTSLAAALAQATVLAVVLLGVFTFGPYLWSTPAGAHASKTAPAPQEAAKTDNKEPAKTTPAPAPAPEPGKTVADGNKPPVTKEALDKLGVTETKKVDPKVNPLDKGVDDLFKDIDKK